MSDAKSNIRPSRVSKRMIAAHVEADVHSEFKAMTEEFGVTNEVLLKKAMALLFENYYRPIPPHVRRTLKSNGLD